MEEFILPGFKVTKEKTIVFLDIDGVLNHRLYYEELMNNVESRGKSKNISQKSCEILNGMHEEIKDVYYVVSSTWRLNITIKGLQERLNESGFTGKIIGITPGWSLSGWGVSVPRGVDIYAWLSKYSNGDNKYVIFDDDSDMMLWQRNNYFQVDGYCGITPNVVYRACRYLRGE